MTNEERHEYYLEKAYLYAEMAHGEQMYGEYPYIFHLIMARNVLKQFGIDDIFINQASILHDVLEDTDTSFGELQDEFGSAIAGLVSAVTNEPGKNRKERHEKTYPKIQKTEGALKIKLADRIANVEHSLQTKNLGKMGMYLKEYPSFRGVLVPHCDAKELEMWIHLDNLMVKISDELNLVTSPK